MALGRKSNTSYGVPVRSAAPGTVPTDAAFSAPTFTAPSVTAPSFAAPAPAPGGFAGTPPAIDFYAAPPSQHSGWTPGPLPSFGVAAAPATAGSGMRNVAIGAAAAVVVGVLAFVAVPAFMRARGAIRPPSTLAGNTRMDDKQLNAQLKPMTAMWRAANSNRPAAIALYQDPSGTPSLVLVATRGEFEGLSDPSSLVDTLGFAESAQRTVGDVTCFADASQPMAMCLWSGPVSGMVMTIAGNDLDRAAAAATEARNALS